MSLPFVVPGEFFVVRTWAVVCGSGRGLWRRPGRTLRWCLCFRPPPTVCPNRVPAAAFVDFGHVLWGSTSVPKAVVDAGGVLVSAKVETLRYLT